MSADEIAVDAPGIEVQGGIGDDVPEIRPGVTYLVDVHVAVAVEVSWPKVPKTEDPDDLWRRAVMEAALEKLADGGIADVTDDDILWQLLAAEQRYCGHRQRREKTGRQDLFCAKEPDHEGNHFHKTHPGGAYWNATSRCWVYGRNSDS